MLILNKKITKVFVFITLISMLLSFAGCSKSKNSDEQNTPSKQTEDKNNVEKNNNEPIKNEPKFKFDTPIELSVIKSADSFFGYTKDQTVSDNAVYDTWEETMGIKFVNKIETSTEAFNQKVKLAILSDDLPDVVASTAEDFDEMIRNDMLVDLSDYIEKYMDPTVREKLNAFDGKLYDPIKRGDAIYGIPATSNVEGSLRTMWIRKDWLEAVGREIPKTMEEVIDLAIAFTKEDPDQNGKDDTWGLPIDKDITKSLLNTYEIVANAYGYYPTRRIKDENGKIILGSMDSGLKDVLTILNNLYKEGAIDPEFTSKDFMQADEGIAAGKYGLWLGVFWKPVDPGMQTTYQEGVEWIQAPIPASETVEEYKPLVQFPATAYYGIRKDYEHPEALIVAVNNYLTFDYADKESFNSVLREIGNQPEFAGIPINNWAALQWQDPLYFSSSPLKKALADPDFDRENPPFQIHAQAYDIISGYTNPDPWQKRQFEDIFLNSIGIHEEYPEENYVFDAFFGAPTETMKSKQSILDKMEVETVMRIITGVDDIEEYDNFIKEYMKLGGEAIIEEMNK